MGLAILQMEPGSLLSSRVPEQPSPSRGSRFPRIPDQGPSMAQDKDQIPEHGSGIFLLIWPCRPCIPHPA